MSEKLRILYVDDEMDLLNLASSFFEDENIPIDVCSDFSDALEMVRKNTYDLIISDGRMPSGSGKELFTILRTEKIHNGKFILVTGNLDFKNDDEKELFDLVMFKPLRFQDLVQEAKRILKL